MTTNNPTTLDQLTALISKEYPTLSKRLKQVAQYLLDNPSSAALGTVAIIAKEAEVQPSTLIRFANALGFSGFSEMQNLFRQKLLIDSPSYTERVRRTTNLSSKGKGKGKSKPHTLFREFSHANSIAIEELSKSVSKQDFDKAVKLLVNAPIIHIVGVRRAFSIASYLAYALRHCDKKAFLIDSIGSMHKEQCSNFSEGEVLLAVSYHPYAQETRETVEAATKKGMQVILITDSQLSPLAPSSTVCFHVAESEVFSIRSLCSSMCLAQALTIGLASALEKN